MWIADGWKDYELLDCGGGEKLERWDKQILVRPDPQAIWNTPRTHPGGWKHHTGGIARSSTGGGHWEKGKHAGALDHPLSGPDLQGQAHEFQAHRPVPGAGGQLGLCPWSRSDGPGRPIRVLNLFAYTGGATVACAAAGASVCHVDAAKGMVAVGPGERQAAPAWRRLPSAGSWMTAPNSWSGKSAGAGGTTPSSWTRPAMAGAPPARCGSWRRTCTPLWSWCVRVLSDQPLFVILNSYTTGLAPSVLGYLSADAGGQALRRQGDVGRAGPAVYRSPVWRCPAALPAGGRRNNKTYKN